MQWVVTDAGLRFAVPKTWTVVPGADAGDPTYDAVLEAYAGPIGSSADSVRSTLRDTDVLAVGKGISSILAGTSDDNRIPTGEELESSFASRGLYAEADDLDTEVGPGRVAYVIAEIEGVRYYPAFLYLPIADGVTTLAITEKSRDVVAYRVSLLLASIADVS